MIIPRLLLGTSAYTGWTALRVHTSIEHCASAADLTVTERWPGADPARATLRPGLRATLQLGTQTVLTGWIDAVSRDLGPTLRTIQLAVRDATGDLVDCSALVRQYTGQTLLQIATDQCGALDLAVAATPNTDLGGPFKRVASEPGQSVFEFLDQLARQRAVLLLPDGQGGLLLGRPGLTLSPTALVEGDNLLGMQAVADWRDRYSRIVVYGQSAGDDDWHGKQAAELRAETTDAAVADSRPRLLVVTAEQGETDLSARADWERRTRAGRALKARARVQGWEAVPGRLWRAGETVRVQAPGMGVSETLVIVGVHYSLDQGGTTTDLELTRPDAYAAPAAREQPPTDTAKVPAGWWM